MIPKSYTLKVVLNLWRQDIYWHFSMQIRGHLLPKNFVDESNLLVTDFICFLPALSWLMTTTPCSCRHRQAPSKVNSFFPLRILLTNPNRICQSSLLAWTLSKIKRTPSGMTILPSSRLSINGTVFGLGSETGSGVPPASLVTVPSSYLSADCAGT
jgi:hypothetical protein